MTFQHGKRPGSRLPGSDGIQCIEYVEPITSAKKFGNVDPRNRIISSPQRNGDVTVGIIF